MKDKKSDNSKKTKAGKVFFESVRVKNSDDEGIITYCTRRALKKVYRAAGSGFIGRFLSGYDKAERSASECFLVKKPRQIYLSIAESRRRKPRAEKLPAEASSVVIYDEETLPRRFTDIVSKQWYSSRVISRLASMRNAVLSTSVSSYGVMLLAFSIALVLSQCAMYFAPTFNVELGLLNRFAVEDFSKVIIYSLSALVILLASVPLMFSGASLVEILFKSRITGVFIRNLMGCRDSEYIRNEEPTVRRFRCFVIGWILGFSSLFVSPLGLLFGLLVFVAAAVTYSVPEVGTVILIFALPFLSFFPDTLRICALTSAYILLCTLLKVLRGARVISVRLTDSFVLAFLLVLLFGGIFSAGGAESFEKALSLVMIGSLYFVISSLMKSWHWIKRVLMAAVASGFIVSVIAVSSTLIYKYTGIDALPFINKGGALDTVFDNGSVLAVYSVICIYVTLAYMTDRSIRRNTVAGMIIIAVNTACILMTASVTALLALIISFVIYLIIRSYKSVPILLLLIPVIITVCSVIPSDTVELIRDTVGLTDYSIFDRNALWSDVFRMATDHIVGGIGVGESAFSRIYPLYAPAGIAYAENAKSLFLQILIEVGIGGFLIFAAAILSIFRGCFTIFRKYRMHTEACKKALALMCGMIALLLIGIFEYIWAQPYVFAIFFATAGMIQAIYRRQTRENTYNDSGASRCDLEIPIKEKKKKFGRKIKWEGTDCE